MFSNRATWSDIEGPISWGFEPWSAWRKAKPGRKLHYRMGMMPTGVTLAQVASGVHDSHYRTAANRLAQYGMLDIEIALGWEMDLRWAPWRADPGSGLADEFAAAWRRIVTVMRQAQPNNRWIWVWNPTEAYAANGSYLQALWPGNEYVDRVGLDIYDGNWWNIDGVSTYYPDSCDAACRLARQQKVWPYRLARLKAFAEFARSKGKPMTFPEWGCATWLTGHIGKGGGDNPYFIQKMHEFFMDPANNVAMQSYFNNNNSLLVHVIGDGVGSTYPQATAKYKQLFGAGSQ